MVNKKGDFPSFVILIAIVFALAIGWLFFHFIFNTFLSNFAGNLTATSPTAANAVTKVNNQMNGLYNTLFIIFFVGMVIAILIFSYYQDVPPVFSVLFIIALGFVVWLAAPLANVYESLEATTALNSSASQLAPQAFVMHNLPLIAAVIGVLIVIIFYSKSRANAGMGGY